MRLLKLSAQYRNLFLIGFLSLFSASGTAQRNAGGRPLHNEAERLGRWKRTEITYDASKLSKRDQQMVLKLVDACRLMNDLYWRQSDLGGLAIYRVTRNDTLRGLFGIMGSRWDLLDGNIPFLGEEPMPPGHELYPYALNRAQIEQYIAQHPGTKAAIYDPRTVVHGTEGKLETVPYHTAYAEWLKPMAVDLRQAAALSTDPAFAKYLRLRADALLSDNYYPSDLAWLDLKSPRIDLIFAPYETYLDNLLGVKTSYGGAILIRNETESRKLALYEKYIPQMQDSLPLPPEDRPSKQGQSTPMEVVDSPLRAGDLRYGYQAVADNLPNDARIHEQKGTKKIFFKNFMDARVHEVILPVARQMMAPDQVPDVSGEGYLATTILHEISHGLGPAYAHVGGKQADIREAIGPAYSGLEEAKADVVGIFCAKWLIDHGLLPQAQLKPIYASYTAGILRTLRFGTGEAHGRAEMMEFNYLLEQGAIQQSSDGKYTVNDAAMPNAIANLAQKLLMLEATGDRAGAEAWMAKYDVMPASLTKALASTHGIPVDIYPVFPFSEGVR